MEGLLEVPRVVVRGDREHTMNHPSDQNAGVISLVNAMGVQASVGLFYPQNPTQRNVEIRDGLRDLLLRKPSLVDCRTNDLRIDVVAQDGFERFAHCSDLEGACLDRLAWAEPACATGKPVLVRIHFCGKEREEKKKIVLPVGHEMASALSHLLSLMISLLNFNRSGDGRFEAHDSQNDLDQQETS